MRAVQATTGSALPYRPPSQRLVAQDGCVDGDGVAPGTKPATGCDFIAYGVPLDAMQGKLSAMHDPAVVRGELSCKEPALGTHRTLWSWTPALCLVAHHRTILAELRCVRRPAVDNAFHRPDQCHMGAPAPVWHRRSPKSVRPVPRPGHERPDADEEKNLDQHVPRPRPQHVEE